MRPLRKFLACLAVTAAALATAASIPAHADEPRGAAADAPQVIPALRSWTGAEGSFHWSDGSRVVVDPQYDKQLHDEADTTAADLADLTGAKPEVVAGEPKSGDAYLTLGGDASLGDEGYTLDVGDSYVVHAKTDAGAFYGTRTLLQLLHQSSDIPRGTATDTPDKTERGLMVDVGRKYFSVGWLKKEIKDLAYAKLNYLHLHFSDNQGFRLQSDSHPEVMSDKYYTKDEIRDLISLATEYHVTLVPEIDMPGHLTTVLAKHPELQLKDSSGNVDPSFIDLSKDDAYTLMSDLIKEYLPLFPGPYWHIGADEYVSDYSKYPQLEEYAKKHYGDDATAKDTYYGFINWADKLVRDGGKSTRMWNDGIKDGDGTIAPNADIVVDYWSTKGIAPQKLLDAGHDVMNSSWTPTYYVLGGTGIDARWLYEDWNADLFEKTLTIDDPARNGGAAIHVWCDNPDAQTEDQVADGIRVALRGLAQQTWNSPKLVDSYADFATIDEAIGRAPGW
jgi:hexosaminidase